MLTEYNVLQGENIFDLVLKFYNDLDQTYAFIQNNPQLENVNFDFASTSNVVVKYDVTYILNTPSEIPTITTSDFSTIGTIKAFDIQTVFDICSMTYGTFDNMYKLLQDNGIDSININTISQKEFTYDRSLIDDGSLYNHISSNNLIFATGFYLQDIVTTYYILTEDSFILDTETGDRLTIE